MWQQAWYEHDLRRIQEVFDERDAAGEKLTTAYVVGTSALGARQGPDGHVKGLVLIDQFCQEMIRRTHGRVRITLMSDHGHNLATSKRIRLRYLLSHMGYRVVDRLEKNGDVVVPEFGMVTCAVFHTRQPARAAADAVAFEGVDLAAYRETASQGENACEEVVVLSRAGRARIDRSAAGFRYRCDFGDPLELLPILEELQTQGRVDAAGFVDDRTLFEATCDHVYPDAVYRLWRAFHGLIVNTPDVYLSIKDGYEVGSPLMGRLVRIKSAHGNLRQLSSYGFAASMVDGLPDTARMIDLRPAMQAAGIPLTDPAVD